jgi:Antitoxin SocA-like, Panacea domain
MPDIKLSREEELVAFFVNRCDGNLGRTRLMKLLYMADYEARRYMGRPISKIKYVWHHYGPYEPGLTRWVNRLKEHGVVVEESVEYPTGQQGFLYTPGLIRATQSFSPAEVEILSYVCRKYSQVQLRELLDDVVYKTEPMVRAQKKNAKGQHLEMGMIDNVKAQELSVSFDELVERRRHLLAGEVFSHAEAMKALEEQSQQLSHAAA